MNPTEHSACPVCRSNSGVERISPGEPIYEARHWLVEHAYPTSMRGWLVIVLKRHAEALHDLTRDESEELGRMQWAVSRALHRDTACLKEYAMFFAEQPRFSHVHVHMVPRAGDLDPELRGSKVFAHLKAPPGEVLDRVEVARICHRLGHSMRALLESVAPVESPDD